MSETRTQTLTEFLLARIAEDEAFALATDVWVGGDAPYMLIDAGDLLPVPAIDPRRVLAECDAKRRIVDWCAQRERVLHSGPVPADMADAGPGMVLMRLLALPFADHPDYRQEWKP